MTSRRVFVGDIHGCLDALDRLLERVEFRPGIDRLHPVGDLVNKGPDSIGVLRRAIELDAEPVIGNHDLHWLDRDRIADPALRDWLAGQPVVRLFDDVVLVHAGLHPGWTDADFPQLADDPRHIDFAVNVRYCSASGERPPTDWPPPPADFTPWDAHYTGTRRVVCGHWARRGLYLGRKVVALDTGCSYGRVLSAWIPEDGRIVQVPA